MLVINLVKVQIVFQATVIAAVKEFPLFIDLKLF
jgi:hypothetical protein